MQPIRTALIDGAPLTREAIATIINSDPRLELVVSAHNWEVGLAAIKNATLDVVLLSVDMPLVKGVTTLEAILQASTVPVVILAEPTVEATAKTVQFISNGAVDFIRLPQENIAIKSVTFKEEMFKKIVFASKSSGKRNSKNKPTHTANVDSNIHLMKQQKKAQTIVAIGASTGGPRALEQILLDITRDFVAPILIVQHMPAGFTRSLAERLNGLAAITVKEAIDGEIIQPHTAYIAPGDYHMTLIKKKGLMIKLTKGQERVGHRPSVNVLFESLALIENINIVAVILTGMGKDGAEGIKQIKRKHKKAVIIAESKESAIVNGMPAAAIETNLVDEIIHCEEMGKVIMNLNCESGGN